MDAILTIHTQGNIRLDTGLDLTRHAAYLWIKDNAARLTRLTVTFDAEVQHAPELEHGTVYAANLNRTGSSHRAVLRAEVEGDVAVATLNVNDNANLIEQFIAQPCFDGVLVYWRQWVGGGKGSTLIEVQNASLADVVEYFIQGVTALSLDGVITTDGKTLSVSGRIVAVKVELDGKTVITAVKITVNPFTEKTLHDVRAYLQGEGDRVRWIDVVWGVANGFPRLGTLALPNNGVLGVWVYPDGQYHYRVLNVLGTDDSTLRVGVEFVSFAPKWEERTFGTSLASRTPSLPIQKL